MRRRRKKKIKKNRVMTGVCIVGALWAILIIVAYAFARRAGEKEWKQFAAVNLIPILGPIFAILVYAIEITKFGEKKDVQ